MQNIKTIIEQLGGNAHIARELGLKTSAVSEMKRRDSIPVWYWKDFISLAKKKKFTLSTDTLISLHSKRARESVTS